MTKPVGCKQNWKSAIKIRLALSFIKWDKIKHVFLLTLSQFKCIYRHVWKSRGLQVKSSTHPSIHLSYPLLSLWVTRVAGVHIQKSSGYFNFSRSTRQTTDNPLFFLTKQTCQGKERFKSGKSQTKTSSTIAKPGQGYCVLELVCFLSDQEKGLYSNSDLFLLACWFFFTNPPTNCS